MATKMTPNSRKVFEFLKGNGVGVEFTTNEVKEALNLESTGAVTGSINGLVKKGYADRVKKVREIDGKEKEVSVFWLTDAGAAFDPDATEAE